MRNWIDPVRGDLIACERCTSGAPGREWIKDGIQSREVPLPLRHRWHRVHKRLPLAYTKPFVIPEIENAIFLDRTAVAAAEPEDNEPEVPLLPAEVVEPGSAAAGEQARIPTTLAGPPLDATPPDIVIPDGLPANAQLPLVEKLDPAAAEASAARARRGLGTKRALYFRIARTRKLLAAWEQVGKYLAQPQRRITKPTEATELIRLLARVQSLLRGFPLVLGQAGQPGYLVIALARQPAPVPMFQTLLPSQRESLAQHWEAGRTFLIAHRQFLRQEVRARRRRSRVSRAARIVASFMAEYPEYVLFALAICFCNCGMRP